MFNLVTLLAVAALLALQCANTVTAQRDDSKMEIDNNLHPNVVPTPRRRLGKYVHIAVPPPTSVHHNPGTRLELDCEARGHPAPTIHWFRNGEPITDYENEENEIPTHQPKNLASLVSKLIVTTVRDGDIFTCVATGDLKEDSASTTVYLEGNDPSLLLEKLFLVPSEPIITSFYTMMLQEIGSTLVLPCRVFSMVDHQVIWRNNNNEIVYGNNRIRVLPSGDLLMTRVLWEDEGNWTCTARNEFGEDSQMTYLYPLKPK